MRCIYPENPLDDEMLAVLVAIRAVLGPMIGGGILTPRREADFFEIEGPNGADPIAKIRAFPRIASPDFVWICPQIAESCL